MSHEHDPEPGKDQPAATWGEWVRWAARRHDQPEPSDRKIDHILWEHTAFPMAGADRIKEQVHGYFRDLKNPQ